MDILKAEIERKKRQLAENKLTEPGRKYFRRGELAAREEEEYRRRYGLASAESAPAEAQPQSRPGAADDTASTPQLARSEVVRRLRDRLEPILLFGETEAEAFRRLRRLEIIEPEVNRGMRNDFQAAMEQVDAAYLAEYLQQGQADPEAADERAAAAADEQRVAMADIQAEADRLGSGDAAFDTQLLLRLYKCLLLEWGDRIHNQPRAERDSIKSKMALATYKQTQQYLKPLFRQLRSGSLPEDIRESLVEIAQYMLDRNYIKANDTYLQMAIGNAAWPIGVTMVGIHARTGREKIFSKHVAHVMNDETQRKFIQGLKRLMTKCQEFYPTDPSRSVEYGGLTEVKRQPALAETVQDGEASSRPA
ncbi:pre-mRNA-splicing factor 18-like [Pollicipes pollicipes]|uniref:pre-mRNA-splicing factor 18-like n=1 Tax=Pollicipes pollicipes TaxID=41117 RepID=UPI0018857829|nr:pre-mRNA-splicing factor 18-like [Pollicipes pollicipes]